MALGNPLDAWLQMAQSKNQNQRNMYGDIAGIGQGLGQSFNTIGQAMEAQKKKALMQQIVSAMRGQGSPQQGPPLAPQGTPQPNLTQIPPGQPMSAGGNIGQDVQMPQPIPTQGPGQPTSGMGGLAQDNSQLIQSLLMQYDPQTAIRNMPTPLQQSEIARNNAQAQRYQGMGASPKPVGTIFRNSVTGEMSDDPGVAVGPEWKAYKTSQGDMLNKLSGQTASKARTEAMAGRNEVWNRSIDTKQIDALVNKTGITPKQQSVLQMNNLRSARAISILNNPKITWQELALGEIDLSGIMQGGVPMRDELVATHFPGWQEQVSKWKTYATGHPQETVPPEIKNKVKSLVQGVIAVDNTVLKANAKFAKSMIGQTIRGGLNPNQTKSINEMTGVLTQGEGQPNAQYDPGKEARYQEWKKTHGY